MLGFMDHGLRFDNALSRFRNCVLQPFDGASVVRPFVVRMFVRRLHRRVNAERLARFAGTGAEIPIRAATNPAAWRYWRRSAGLRRGSAAAPPHVGPVPLR